MVRLSRFLGIATGLALLSGCPLLTGPDGRVASLLVEEDSYVYEVMPHDYIEDLNWYIVDVRLTIVNRSEGVLVIERCESPTGPIPRAVLVRDETFGSGVAYSAPLECDGATPLVMTERGTVTLELTFKTLALPRVPEFGVPQDGQMRAQVFTNRGAIESDRFVVLPPAPDPPAVVISRP